MELVRLDEIFDIVYGNGYALNQLENGSIPFVARGAANNGITDYVCETNISPFEANTITVAVSGSVLECFYQTQPFYTAYHVKVLKPKHKLNQDELLAYCTFIKANKYRYNYGRQANKTLKDIKVPSIKEVKKIVSKIKIPKEPSKEPFSQRIISLGDREWKEFQLGGIFKISLGKPLHKNEIDKCSESYINDAMPYVSRTAINNGVEMYLKEVDFEHKYINNGNCITVGAEGFKAFYQKIKFATGNKINIVRNKQLNCWNAFFVSTILNLEMSNKFSYGRGAVKSRLEKLKIKLPATTQGKPDWQFMEDYIKSLPYSSNL